MSAAAVAALGLTAVLKALAFVYDLTTLPVYFFLQKPWVLWQKQRAVMARHLDPNDPYSPIVRVDRDQYKPENEPHNTLWGIFEESVRKNAKNPLFGTREVLDECVDEKGLRKVRLGDYKWVNYEDARARVEEIRRGILEIGVTPGKPVNILSETRVEWMMVALACWKINVPVSTLYATLGEDGIAHGLSEIEAEFVFTSADLLPKLKAIIPKAPLVRFVVFFEGPCRNPPDVSGFPSRVTVLPFTQVEKLGKESKIDMDLVPLTKGEDLALYMYTSGTTEIPKAVCIKHCQLTAIVYEYNSIVSYMRESEAFLAFLPLAHLYELASEVECILNGMSIGYSSPHTLTSQSPGLMPNCKGDFELLRPAFISQVPLTLDRIRKGITNKVNASGTLAKTIFNFALSYKIKWWRKGFNTPILDYLIFRKMKEFLGGNVKCIVTGSAPLSRETEEFISAALCVDILNAYGMTETVATGTFSLEGVRLVGQVGVPPYSAYIKLVDWEEGGYHVTDKPKPRGEILIGGRTVANCYFKRDELSKETFLKIDGIQYCKTGDIGELLPNGCLKIIDRKKDLVKLQMGEYISLGKVEAELKTCPLVDNVCVHGQGLSNDLVALVSPNKEQLAGFAEKLGKKNLTFEEQCNDQAVVEAFQVALAVHGKHCRLTRREIPAKMRLCSEPWTPESGLVTAAFKLRRRYMHDFYKKELDQMYKSLS